MFTLDQVFVLIGLFCLVTALIVGWITALLVIRSMDADGDRRVEDMRQQMEAQHAPCDAAIQAERDLRNHAFQFMELGASILTHNKWSIERSKYDSSNGKYTELVRETLEYDSAVDFLYFLGQSMANKYTINYTRMGSLVLSN